MGYSVSRCINGKELAFAIVARFEFQPLELGGQAADNQIVVAGKDDFILRQRLFASDQVFPKTDFRKIHFRLRRLGGGQFHHFYFFNEQSRLRSETL